MALLLKSRPPTLLAEHRQTKRKCELPKKRSEPLFVSVLTCMGCLNLSFANWFKFENYYSINPIHNDFLSFNFVNLFLSLLSSFSTADKTEGERAITCGQKLKLSMLMWECVLSVFVCMHGSISNCVLPINIRTPPSRLFKQHIYPRHFSQIWKRQMFSDGCCCCLRVSAIVDMLRFNRSSQTTSLAP